jgi:Protein of unknown function (DUF664)
VADQKPPRGIDDERATVGALLQFQRDSLVRKVSGVEEADARAARVPSGTTLLWLVKHLERAEALWVLHRFAGLDIQLSDDAVGPTDTVTAVIASYQSSWARVDAVVASANLDDVCQNVGAESLVNLRWVLMHLLEETARHAGHADILRELIDGQTGR